MDSYSKGILKTVNSDLSSNEKDLPPIPSGHITSKVEVDHSFIKLLFPGLLRCTVSGLLIAGFYISVWNSKDQVVSPKTKAQFDAITVALSIAFGLNIVSSLKAIVLDLRWWILSIERRPLREVNIILHCDSMTELLKLVYVAPRRSTVFASLIWVSLNLLAQAGISVLGLTFSANPGVGDVYRMPGLNNVSVPNMTHFAPTVGRFTDYFLVESFGAHILGDIGSSYNFSLLPNHSLIGMPWASNPAAFWNVTDHWEYIFLDSAPSVGTSGPNFLSIYSNRTVTSRGTCDVPPFNVSINGSLATIHPLNGKQNATFPALALGFESIYYLTTPLLDHQNSTGACGPGCSNVKVLEPAAGPPAPGSFVSDAGYYYYDCNITVTSTTTDLSPHNAAVAAQAIALSGQVHSELASTNEPYNEYIPYTFGLPFGEAQNNSATGMANLLSRFAIGVIAAAAQTNPPMIVQGGQPAQGIRLELGSPLVFNLILGLTGGVQLVLVIITAAVVSRLEIPKDILWSHEEIRRRFVL